jgi:hypothetical protein
MNRTMFVRSLFPMVLATMSLLLFAGCGSGNSGESTDTPTPDAGSGGKTPEPTPAAADVVGAFNVIMIAATDSSSASTSVSGAVFDGPTPANIAWDLSKTSGGCQLFKARAPFCDPGCTGTEVCVDGGRCLRQPVSQDLGTVSVSGLGSSPIVLDGIANIYDLPIDTNLTFPPAAEGADITLSVSAGPYGPFAITSQAVAPLAAPSAFTMERGKAMQVTWTAPGQPALAHMRVYVDISHHGGTKGKIECDVPDNGSLSIDATLVNGLLDMGVAGFPKTELHRFVRGTAAVSKGIVKLEVDSPVTRQLQIAGFTSCNADADCPTGKACQPNALCAK